MTPRSSGTPEASEAIAVYLVRHCHAQAREAWAGSDEERPLTERGTREAKAIADRFETGADGTPSRDLGAVPLEPRPTSLMSSSAERCLATLRPLSAACGLEIATAEFLAEGSDPGEVLTRLKDSSTGGRVPVVCTHGDVIWGIVQLLEKAGVRLAGPLDVRKGSIWVIETVSGSVKSARYIPPAKV